MIWIELVEAPFEKGTFYKMKYNGNEIIIHLRVSPFGISSAYKISTAIFVNGKIVSDSETPFTGPWQTVFEGPVSGRWQKTQHNFKAKERHRLSSIEVNYTIKIERTKYSWQGKTAGEILKNCFMPDNIETGFSILFA